ncbi:MAG: hypothetical protein WCF85_15740, partial [Rhodospirillaceae bacterium]
MLTRRELRTAIRDLQEFDRRHLTTSQLASVDTTWGLFLEAYAQTVLDERNLNIDVSRICGFTRFAQLHG